MTFIFDIYFFVKGWKKRAESYHKDMFNVYPPTPSREVWYLTTATGFSSLTFTSFWALREHLKYLGVL